MPPTLRQLILEEKCPRCGDPKAYVGLNDVECPNRGCKAFSQRQADDVAGKPAASAAKRKPRKFMHDYVRAARNELRKARLAADALDAGEAIDKISNAIDFLVPGAADHRGSPAVDAVRRVIKGLGDERWASMRDDEMGPLIGGYDAELERVDPKDFEEPDAESWLR